MKKWTCGFLICFLPPEIQLITIFIMGWKFQFIEIPLYSSHLLSTSWILPLFVKLTLGTNTNFTKYIKITSVTKHMGDR